MKHLHADLSNLSKRQLPELPAIQLPSGPAYIRPMKISAIDALVCYSYDLHWYSDSIDITALPLTLEHALQLSYPKFPTALRLENYRKFLSAWTNIPFTGTRYFRTVDDALLDAFIQYPTTRNYHPEFDRLKQLYPEYFI